MLEANNAISGISSQQDRHDYNPIEYRGDGLDIEQEFEQRLVHKHQLFRTMLIAALHEESVALKFNTEECKRIIKYAQQSYFLHLRLYEFALNNTTASEMKRVTFN